MGSSKVQVGEVVPSFTVPATSGSEFDLQKFKGKNVVLYFYPKDATPGCTIQGHEFTKLLPEFKKTGTEVFGISRDSIKSHEKFKAKECYTFDLLSDEDEALCRLFGVMKEKNMYGKKVWGVERSTFLIDREGRLAAEWRGVKAEENAQEVLSKVQSLSVT
ncbi:MAG: peroxiredoxin [Bdellovibrio sp.]